MIKSRSHLKFLNQLNLRKTSKPLINNYKRTFSTDSVSLMLGGCSVIKVSLYKFRFSISYFVDTKYKSYYFNQSVV